MSDGKIKPTARLRWVIRSVDSTPAGTTRVLQQWWAADVPSYMVDPTQGEWRDVPMVEGP